MSKQAKIDSFKEGKQLTHGKVYAIAFDNGDTGEAILKQEPAIGETWEYDLEPNGTYPDKIKRAGQNKFAGKPGGYPRGPEPFKVSSMSISYAKDLVVAGKIEVKETTAYAQKFYDWIKERE